MALHRSFIEVTEEEWQHIKQLQAVEDYDALDKWLRCEVEERMDIHDFVNMGEIDIEPQDPCTLVIQGEEHE